MKRRGYIGLILVLLFSFAAVGCGSDENTGESGKKENSVEEKKEYKINDVIILEGMELKIDEVKYSKGNEFDKPKDGNEFVIVKVSIKNTGDKKISYNPFDYSIENSDGQITTQTISAIDSKTSLSSGELAPEGKISGTIVFEAPKEDKNLKLLYKNNMFKEDADCEIILN